MKGFATENSPFARKVRVVAIETGQTDAIDWTMVDLNDRPSELGAANPLGQVPVITDRDGEALFDSPVICAYLDSLHDGDKLIPQSGTAHWTALRLQALGDGLGGASAALAGERRRPEERRFEPFIANQTGKIAATLDVLEGDTDTLAATLSIGGIAVACAIGYMELRHCQPGWRSTRPLLAAWYDAFCERRSMRETALA